MLLLLTLVPCTTVAGCCSCPATVAGCCSCSAAVAMLYGMPEVKLKEVFQATVLAILLHATPAWWGFTTSTDQDRLAAFLRKAIRYGYYPTDGPSLEDIVERNDNTLFRSIMNNPDHTLYPLVSPKKQCTYNLCQRAHSFTIPPSISALHDKNFIVRMIRENSY